MLVSNAYPSIQMKRFPLYILLASSVLFTSCEKELNQLPSGSLPSEESVSSLSGLTSAVRGVYSRLNTRYGYSGETAIFADGRGGDVKIVVGSYNHSTAIHQFLTDKSSGFSAGAYQAFATTSSRVNDILQYVGSVEKMLSSSEKTQFNDQHRAGAGIDKDKTSNLNFFGRNDKYYIWDKEFL